MSAVPCSIKKWAHLSRGKSGSPAVAGLASTQSGARRGTLSADRLPPAAARLSSLMDSRHRPYDCCDAAFERFLLPDFQPPPLQLGGVHRTLQNCELLNVDSGF